MSLGNRINKESIIDIEAIVKATNQKITSCSMQDIELSITQVC